MSRQRRAAPSISAAAATAARRSSSVTRRSPFPGTPRTASRPTLTLSSVSDAQRVPTSIALRGFSPSPAAAGSTRKSVTPSGGAAHLVEEDRRLHHAESAAAVRLGQRQSQPPELGHVLPHRLALAPRVVPQPAHDGRGALLVEERARRVLEKLLVVVEREVHHFTRSARASLGRPSTRSPMTFFWISDEPE